MQTGYSIFGGPVETMDGPVRPVSIQPRFVGSGPAYPGGGPAHPMTVPGYPGSGPAYPGSGPAHHHRHHPMQGYGQVVSAAAMPPPPPMQAAWGMPSRIAAPSARGGGRPPVMHPQIHPQFPGAQPIPMSTMPRYAAQPMPMSTMPRYAGPQMSAPVPYPPPSDCGCQEPMPLRGPIQYYDPTPSSPISPTYGACPLPQSAPMTDGCGNPIQMIDDCGNPIPGTGVHRFHPGGNYPITEMGPGLNDGLTRRQVLHGQLPVGAGTDIFGGQVSALDPMRGRPIGPPCGGGVGSRVQPQTPYNHPLECHRHIPGTGHGAGIFRPLRGYGGGPDGLGGVSQAAAGFGAVPLHWFCYTPFGERVQRCVPTKLPF